MVQAQTTTPIAAKEISIREDLLILFVKAVQSEVSARYHAFTGQNKHQLDPLDMSMNSFVSCAETVKPKALLVRVHNPE